jgi:hypothetical protein
VKHTHFQTVGGTVSLRNDSQCTGFETEDHWQTYKAFFAGQAYFNALPIGLDCQHGAHPVIYEVTRLDDFPGLVEHLMKFQAHELQSGEHPRAFRPREAPEDQISYFFVVVGFDYAACRTPAQLAGHKMVPFVSDNRTQSDLAGTV